MSKSNSERKKPDMVAPKPICIVLIMVLILGLAGMPGATGDMGCGDACCLRHDARIPQHVAEAREVPHAQGCCCGEIVGSEGP